MWESYLGEWEQSASLCRDNGSFGTEKIFPSGKDTWLQGRDLGWKLVFRCTKHSSPAFLSEEQVCIRRELPLSGETDLKGGSLTCGVGFF